jgi:hypothetical protein
MQKQSHLSEVKQRLLEIQRRPGGVAPATSTVSEMKCCPEEIPAPLSREQEQLWRLDQTAGKQSPLHNESITIHRRGPCDPTLVERSLAEIIRRHEIWRTTFEVVEGRPVQVVHPPTPFTLPVTDLRSLPPSEREKKAVDLATQDARQPFDLKQGPLLRARLITLDDAEHRLYLTAHQIIVDGITVFDLFPFELTTLYESFAEGKSSPLLELQTQYADYACWQRRSLSAEPMENQLAYWQKQLAGELPVLQWPSYGVRPEKQTFRGAMLPFEFSSELSQSLKELGRREGATLFMILLAALVSLLHRYTSQDDIIVGTLAASGRKQIEVQHCLGYFLNPVALRANLSGNPSFSSILRQMRDVTLGALSNDGVPLELIAERLNLKPDPGRHRFFTVAISIAPAVPQLPRGWSMTYMDVESGGARWDLYLELNDRIEGLLGRAQYNPDLFTPAAIGDTVEDFRLLLEDVAASR